MTTSEPWVSVEDVAAHLGVARDSVYRWIEGRGLPAHRIGRLWKFRLSDVDEGSVPYAIAVTLEVADAIGVDIYAEVRERVRERLRVHAGRTP